MNELINLITFSDWIDREYWLNKLPQMNKRQRARLYVILLKHKTLCEYVDLYLE